VVNLKTAAFAVALLLGYEENTLSWVRTFSPYTFLGDDVT